MFRKWIENYTKTKNYKNVIDASFTAEYLRIIFGGAGVIVKLGPGNKVVHNFSKLGIFFIIFWISFYYYCTIKAFIDGQSIPLTLFQSKLRNYGEGFERITSAMLVTYCIWKVPFHLSCDHRYLQKIVDTDRVIQVLGVEVDFSRSSVMVFGAFFAQVCFYVLRVVSILLIFINLKEKLPMERMYQTMYSDAAALLVSSYFTYYLVLLRTRYKIINDVLKTMCHRKAWDTINVREKHAINLHYSEYRSERIKTCAKIYSMLFEASEIVNKMFGLPLAITLFLSLCNIILYLFYLMEATATGMFLDVHKYAAFLILIGWQIGYSLAVIQLNIYTSDSVVTEAKLTGTIIHAIVNYNDAFLALTNEAMLFSMQVLHQRPVFAPCGLYIMDYVLLQEIIRTVITFLVVLIQFATDS